MACEPFECDRCGERHTRCTGHVALYDEDGNKVGERACIKWPYKTSVVCDKHGGAAPQIRAKAERRLEQQKIRREVERLGVQVETDPAEALINEIWESAGNVEYYRARVQELHGDEGVDGLYTKTIHQSGRPTGEAKPHVLVQMYNEERTRLVNASATAIRLGIEERRVRLEEGRAAEIFRAMNEAFMAMGLMDRFEEYRGHFASSISEIRRQLPRGA